MDDLAMQRTKQAVESEAAARSTRAALGLLAGELRVDIKDLDESQQNLVALRFVLADKVNAKILQDIVDSVRENEDAEGGGSPPAEVSSTGTDKSGSPVSLASPSAPPKRSYKFNSTEATDWRYRQRLALAHRHEDMRSGLYLVPRRPDPMPVDAVHPPCWASFNDGGTPCSRCAPRLHPGGCECEPCQYADAWMDDVH